ncbi:MAG TPA: response regulator, partial [Gammaproteobacteria bacterium]|nr:response regulator [Gammaproteobacteria bacterium]
LAAAQQIRQLTSRAQLSTKRPPLIAITANAFPEDRQICLEAGMDDYLAKPFSWPEFNALLARWLSDDHSNGEDTGRDVRAA